jgi:DNA-directed RNA polymerase I, II, and III subunit RPABC1
MTTSNSTIISIFNSRKYLLEILNYRGFDTSNYENTNISEIGILSEQNQLDMLLNKPETGKKIYVKFYVEKTIKSQNIYSIIEDLFHLESILTKNDDLIIIVKDEPNDTLIETVKDIWTQENIYLSLINIKRLQFNILNHSLVPKHTILTKKEEEEFKKKYNILDNKNIPDISYFSPVSIVLGIRPNNIVKIERKSRTAVKTEYYRVCKIY